MTTKLHIDISQGVVDVEGDPELVREVYRDFCDQLLGKVSFAKSSPQAQPASPVVDDPKSDTLADTENYRPANTVACPRPREEACQPHRPASTKATYRLGRIFFEKFKREALIRRLR